MTRVERRTRAALVLIALGIGVAGIWGRSDCTAAPLHPSAAAELFDDSGLHLSRFGAIEFLARDGNRLHADTYRATRFDAARGPIWFVMHGVGRQARPMVEAAAPVAERHDALAIAIRFPKDLYPRSSSYTLGIGVGGKVPGTLYDPDEWRDPDDFLYAELEHVFDAVRATLGGGQEGYYVFGHSAGAQFTHRLLTFLPHARVLGAVSANAGWYTLPLRGRPGDRNTALPYGLQGTPLEDDDVRTLLAAPLTILVGELDSGGPDVTKNLRGTKEAMAQGTSRRERAGNYYRVGEAEAASRGVPFGWRFQVVPGAGHDKDEMMPSAGFFLFEPAAEPCSSSTAQEASGLVITEIQADPARGQAGDVNHDGRRDSQEDEFVELVNTGSTSLCLTGWTLSDVAGTERHRFPVDRALPPGGALVVFGGGQPTGAFGGADVQWASFGGRLGLSNSGDVLTLRDANGTVVTTISWGDRDGASPGEEHLPRDLEIGGSVVRWPEPSGPWRVHAEVGRGVASPGTRADGSPW